MRRTLLFGLGFALASSVLTTWLAPRAISYWYQPPVAAGAAAAFNCTEAVQWGMHRLIQAQLLFTAIGFLLGLLVAFAMRRKIPPHEGAAATLPAASATPLAQPPPRK